MKTIAIIGGGFSGTMAAVNMARLSTESLRVIVINGKRPLGRGAAYGTNRTEHLLNVAARNMSALPDHPTHFVDWLRSRSEFNHLTDSELCEMFVPRKVYGDYICGLLAAYLHPIDPVSRVDVQVIGDEATAVAVADARATVALRKGEPVSADMVLLATGNQSPGAFPCDSPLSFDRRYCGDPWDDWHERLPAAGGHVVLLGTGLTAVDVIVTLAELKWQGRITAISRSGLLPRPHFRGIAYPDFVAENGHSLKLDELVRLVQQQCRKLERMSQNPAIAIDKLRPHTQRIWRGFSVEEKRAFLSRYGARWNSFRHRIAVDVHQCVTDALDAGRLEIVEGNIRSLAAREKSLDVHLGEAGDGEKVVSADLVINCTGPQTRLSQTESPLLQQMLKSGLIRTDALDMGIEVDDDFRAVGPEGTSSATIFAIGPLLRGSLWETTAVPELRGQAMGVAQTMLDQHRRTPEEYVIEYCI